MAVISDLEVLVQDRLEEIRDGVGIFWSVKNEIRPLLAEAMNEATLITGLPQIRSGVPFTLNASNRIFGLSLTFSQSVANRPEVFVVARIDGVKTLEKTSFWALDQNNPTWEQDTGPLPLKWFPFGVGQFGIYPLLTADVQVFLTTINLPVAVPRPYTGTENVPFSVGFQDGLVNCAAAIARLKEGGKDMVEGLKFYEMFLSKMVDLSKFGDRISKLRFTRAVGATAQATDTEIR